jgi:beta-galactosidase
LDLSKVPPISVEDDPERTIGILFDFDQLWYYKSMPQALRWDQPRWLLMWYHAAARLGLRVKVLNPDSPWPTNLRAIIAPGVQMVDGALVQRWRDYATAGGHLVLTCRTALMDRNGQAFEGPTAAPILDLIGGTIEAYDGLPANTFGQIEFDTRREKYQWGTWGDLLYTENESRVIARYADQFYAGAAAIIENPVGTGLVTYCGVYPEQPLINALVQRVATQSKLKTQILPDRVHLLRRGPYHILLNYQDKPVQAPAPAGATFIVGSRAVEPAGVAVWKEQDR